MGNLPILRNQAESTKFNQEAVLPFQLRLKDFEMARKIEEVVLWRPAGGPLGTGNPKPFVFSKQYPHSLTPPHP